MSDNPIKRPDLERASYWNPRFLAYCRMDGADGPENMLAKDRERYPGGLMTGYMLWIRRMIQQWATETSHPRSKSADAPLSERDHHHFTAWLELLPGEENDE